MNLNKNLYFSVQYFVKKQQFTIKIFVPLHNLVLSTCNSQAKDFSARQFGSTNQNSYNASKQTPIAYAPTFRFKVNN